jgi:hypothetical protein
MSEFDNLIARVMIDHSRRKNACLEQFMISQGATIENAHEFEIHNQQHSLSCSIFRHGNPIGQIVAILAGNGVQYNFECRSFVASSVEVPAK